MGIPAYFSFLVKNYPRILNNIGNFEKKPIHNLLLDSNSIIYEALHNNINNFDEFNSSQLFEEHLINCVIKQVEEYILFIKPSDVLYISFDGVAPLAKMKQQRIRRNKSLFTNEAKFNNCNILFPFISCLY